MFASFYSFFCSNIIKIFPLTLIVVSIFLTFYSLIMIPAKMQRRQISFIKDRLRPGVKIITHNEIAGTVILVLDKTLIVEQKNGLKVEILKNSVRALDE